MRFSFDKANGNHHGTNKKGEPWNEQTVRGPRFKFLALEGFNSSSKLQKNIGWRVIFYFPSGACWYFDAYKTKAVKS